MRWSKAQGLPVGRVAGGRGRSVFAFTDQIDLWLTTRPADAVPDTAAAAAEPSAPDAGAVPPVLDPALAVSPRRRSLTVAAAVVAAAALVAVISARPEWTSPEGLRISVDQRGVVRAGADGTSTLIYPFDPGLVPMPLPRPDADFVNDLDTDGTPDILVALAYEQDVRLGNYRSGTLHRLDAAGALRWKYTLDDRVTFQGQRYAGPWALADWRLSPGVGRRRIATAAHHFTWWPGIVALLDDGGRRIGTFVNAGWIETVRWDGDDRLVAAGFNNPRDGGMIAVLDARNMNGRSPDADGPFACSDCPPGDPLQYMVFPRSELNLLSGARFNRARVEMRGGRYLVNTEEVTGDADSAVAMYELDADFTPVKGTFSDTYWDVHRRLELEGRVTHSAAVCPTRSGPPWVDRWSRATGWQRVAVPPGIPGG